MKKLKKKYNDMSRPLKASLWFMFSSVINKGIAFFTTPIFSRMLTKEEFGVVGVYSTWVVLLTIVLTFSLATGVFNKAMIKYEDDKDGYTSSSLILMTLFVCFFGVVYCIFQKSINSIIDLPQIFIIFMFFEILSTTTWDLYAVRNRFDYKYKSIVIVTILVNVFATVLSIILVRMFPNNKAEARVAGLVLTHTCVYVIFYIIIILKGRVFVKKDYWHYSLKYNLPLIPHYLSQQVLSQSDRIMIDKICGKEDAGIYSLAYQVAVAMQIITNAVHVSFMPWCFQCLKDGETQKIGRRAFQIELLVGMICLTFSLFAPEFILFVGGRPYYSAIYIIPPVSMSIVFLTIYSFFGNIEFYYEKTKLVMYASIIVAVCNVLLNWIFIPVFGFVAAGYTTLLCYISFAAVHYIFMSRICKSNKIENPFNGKKMWFIAGVFAIIAVGVSVIYKYTVLRISLAISLIIALCIFGYKYKKNLY